MRLATGLTTWTRSIIWPLLALTVQLTIAMPTVSMLWSCFLGVTMAVMAVVGAMVRTVYKWGKLSAICASFSLGNDADGSDYRLLWVLVRSLGDAVLLSRLVSSALCWSLWKRSKAQVPPQCWLDLVHLDALPGVLGAL